MKQAIKLIPLVVVLGAIIVFAQGRGTPSQLRVLVDGNGALVTASAAQSGSTTAVTLNNARLATDANGALLTTLGSSSQQLFSDGTASAPGIAYSAETNTGFRRSGGGTVIYDAAGSDAVVFGGNTVGVTLHAGSPLQWGSAAVSTPDTSLARGGAAGKITLTGTTPTIQLGGTTSSFPALKQSSSSLQIRLADDSAYAGIIASTLSYATGGGIYNNGTNALIYATSPSAPASCGTSPAVTASNGSAAWVVTGGTGGTATGCTITMPTATTGWNCNIFNITQTAAHRADRDTRQTASTTTSVTWEYVTVSTGVATAFTASDVFRGICIAY